MELSYHEKAILVSFNRFYGEHYNPKEDNRDRMHTMALAMGYLFQKFDIWIGDYKFAWNEQGLCSSEFERDLTVIDEHPDLIENYYTMNTREELQFSNFNEFSIFRIDQRNVIDWLARKLEIMRHTEDLRDWMELLGSLAYLYNCKMSDAGLREIGEELKRRNPYFNNRTRLCKAWLALKAGRLVEAA